MGGNQAGMEAALLKVNKANVLKMNDLKPSKITNKPFISCAWLFTRGRSGLSTR